jgi:hypothetical protein
LDEMRRYRFLEDNPAVVRQGWLPPASEVPELGDLRADHDRLTDAVAQTGAEAMALRGQRAAEVEARRAAQEQSFLGGEAAEALPELTVTDAELAEAAIRAEAARDALQTFAQTVVTEVTRREPQLVEQLDEVTRAAAVKRAEAERMLVEAQELETSTRKLGDWLARTTGRNVFGHYPWEDLPTPVPMPDQQRTLADLSEANSPGFGSAELDGSPYGTDHPENLDADATPWEVELPEEVNV